MKVGKFKLCFLQFILMFALFFAWLLAPKNNLRIVLAVFLPLYAIIVKFILKRNGQLDTRSKRITKIIVISSILYICLFYTLGIYSGFYRSTHPFNLNTILYYIVPFAIIITSTEYIRYKFISSETKISKVINFIIMIFIDICLFYNLYGFDSLDDFLLSIGYLLFASVASNLLYNFISKRYGYKPVIYYRLITTLYAYIIPILPDVYIFFTTFFRMIYPLIVYYIIMDNSHQSKEIKADKKNKKTIWLSAGSFAVMIIFIMLVSCQFRFGALVVGSSSMSNSISKGDVIIYDDKGIKDLKIGDVIVFNSGTIRVVHRIVDMKTVNNELAYYTRGDNNDTIDDGYVVEPDIYGKVIKTIPKIGLPTLYLHNVFNNSERGEI